MAVSINLSESNSVSLVNSQPNAVTISTGGGDITSVTINAGDGLTGGGTDTTGNVDLSLAVGAGTGIQVNADSVELNHLGLEDLTDPNADKIFFWDDSEGAAKFLTIGDNLTITNDTLDAAAVSGDAPAIIDSSGTPTLATGITGDEIRTLIGAGTSSFSGSYNDLTDTPSIPSSANDATITIEAGTGLGTGGAFTTDQSVNETITLTNTDKGSDQFIFKNVASDSGTAVADTNDDTLTIAGGSGISTAVVGDTLTIVNDSPDQTVSLTEGSNVTITGTYPNFTIAATDTDTTYSTATASVEGLVKIGYTESGKNYPVELDAGQMYVNVPWTDTDTDTVTSVGVSGSETTGTVTIAASGAASVSQVGSTITISATDTDTDTVTSVGVSGSETTGTVTIAGSGATSVSQVGNTVTISSTDNDTTYSTATASVEGLVKIGYTESGQNYPVELDSGQMYVNVPWTDTDTDTITSVGISGSETTGTITIAGSGATSVSQVGNTVTISSTDTDTDTVTSVGVSGSETTGTVTIAASGAASVSQVGNTVTISATDTDTTYSTATASVEGLVKIGYTESGQNYPVELDAGQMYVNVPWTDTDTDTITSVGVSGSETTGTVTIAASGAASVSQVGNTVTISATDTDTTYSTATASVEGLVKIGYTESGQNYPVELDAGQMYVNVPWTDTDTDTITSVGVSGSETTGTITIAGSGATSVSQVGNTVTISSTDTDTDTITSVGVSGSETTGTVTIAASGAASVSQVGSTVTISATDTDTTYSTATASVEGLVKIGYTESGQNYPVELDAGQMYVNVPWTDTDTDTITSVGVSGSETTGTVTIAASGAASVSQVGSTVTISATDTDTTYSTATASVEGLVKIGYTESGQNYPVELDSGQMYVNVPWTDTDTDTITSVGVSGSETTGTVTIAASGAASVSQVGNTVTISATDTDTNTTYDLASAQSTNDVDITLTGSDASSDTVKLVAGTNITLTDNGSNQVTIDASGGGSTYTAGSGLDLSGTVFSVETDLRDGITHVGVNTNNYITFDSTNNRMDFYAGGVHVARMESDGDLHVKGDVIAFSSIF